MTIGESEICEGSTADSLNDALRESCWETLAAHGCSAPLPALAKADGLAV